MPAYYSRALPAFLADSTSTIIGELTQANGAARFPLSPEAIDAWREQLPPLTASIRELIQRFPDATGWQILLEYPIPMIGKRIDAVLLAKSVIVVIETKTGTSRTSATRQVEDYALNLACFHEGSAGRVIVPLVITAGLAAAQGQSTAFDQLIERCRISSFDDCAKTLYAICTEFSDTRHPLIDPIAWDNSRFKPVPPIIDAAVALYSDMNVFEIGHSCAAREDLDSTTETIVSAVEDARANNRKVICFVTGVPGAGKTLVGLNAVHRPEIKKVGSFLSGNGPLVKVIQEALVRDVTLRPAGGRRVTRREAELEIRAFIHNVHRFADEYYRENQKVPAQKVVIFDEAQRAWDATQNQQAKRPAVSEPKMMLEVMERHQDWAVVVALVGGGQEINRGEAGLAEWGRALTEFPDWQIWASPHVLSSNAASAFRLFDDSLQDGRVHRLEQLHLRVCTRSIRAQRISDWVDAVLTGKQNEACAIAELLPVRPSVTRNLSNARRWLESNRRGTTRSGLVASAYAARLRADGLEPAFEFHRGFEWEHWFLDSPECELPNCDHRYCGDVRASSKLEVIATQFEIQGLELDWVGVCWGEDLLWDESKWQCRRFNNKRWKILPDDALRKRTYLLNAYRVLLTRARQNMIIYIPKPNPQDESRLPQGLDRTAAFLVSCGARPFAP
ncbi:MAG TPA: DNA/RNA helicase domain-containing protein [Terriglobales bacterium]|nr:DNA/RNA helicase domain-containing protein [Terriglobales bacterium]